MFDFNLCCVVINELILFIFSKKKTTTKHFIPLIKKFLFNGISSKKYEIKNLFIGINKAIRYKTDIY